MANPLIPGISATEQDLLYKKLSIYNQKKASFKEAGYLVYCRERIIPGIPLGVLARKAIHLLYLRLNEMYTKPLRIASTPCYYSLRPLLLVEYNAKRMQKQGRRHYLFGKYHGHYLHEILRMIPVISLG